MRLLGYPHIKGYQPRFNFQSLLMEEVESQLQQCQALEAIVQFAVTQPAVEYLAPDGHPKPPHLWPVKLLQAGQGGL